mmetsp:Transcript_22076/g.61277  ORF Transcript_22076/g.61277 Transcript_22076/m.61277 type:complete len:226 (-) Transcript_22076:189-866(-)
MCYPLPNGGDSVHNMVVPHVLRQLLLADLPSGVWFPCFWSGLHDVHDVYLLHRRLCVLLVWRHPAFDRGVDDPQSPAGEAHILSLQADRGGGEPGRRASKGLQGVRCHKAPTAWGVCFCLHHRGDDPAAAPQRPEVGQRLRPHQPCVCRGRLLDPRGGHNQDKYIREGGSRVCGERGHGHPKHINSNPVRESFPLRKRGSLPVLVPAHERVETAQPGPCQAQQGG